MQTCFGLYKLSHDGSYRQSPNNVEDIMPIYHSIYQLSHDLHPRTDRGISNPLDTEYTSEVCAKIYPYWKIELCHILTAL